MNVCILVEFEKNEKKRLEAEMEAYAKQLEKDTNREKEQQDRKIEQLNKRKEDMIKEKKQKMNVSVLNQLELLSFYKIFGDWEEE